MSSYPEQLLAVIMASEEKAKGDLLPQAPMSGAEWDLPPLPSLPGRQGLDRVSSRKRRRKGLNHEGTRLSFLHAIWHIEMSAIDLACLCCLRGSGMPREFHAEFLNVAAEEVVHAGMVRSLLEGRGYPPGSEPVHDALWVTALKADDLGEQLVLVPRVLEARGLDASRELMPRMNEVDAEAASVLQRIYDDEIGHVSRGNDWHKVWCEQRDLDPKAHLAATIERCMPGETALMGPMDREGRLQAGFTEDELSWLESQRQAVREARTL